MKHIIKFSGILLTATLLFSSLTACGNSITPSVSNEGIDADYKLQTVISQEEWNNHRQYVELSTGITMSYVEMGNPEGEPLILQHGMTDNSRSWSMVAPYFAKAGYHVYMPDLRGHGYTDKPDDGMYTPNMYAADLAAFMDEMEVEKVSIVGHSLGSMMAQTFMFAYPERCNHVVLVSTNYGSSDKNMSTSMYEMALNLGDAGHPDDEFMSSWYSNPNPVDETFLKYEMKESQQLNSTAWRCISTGNRSLNLAPYYPFFDDAIPTLIMHGTLDDFFAENAQELLCEALPFAEYKEYENIGHNMHWEMPEQFAKDVLEFIAA